jgi:hypothetical protein
VKRFHFLLLFLFAFALSACTAVQGAAQGFVDLPVNIEASIIGLVVSVFALVIDYLIGILPPALGWVGEFLKKYQQEWALAAGAGVVVWLENFLPTGSEDVSIKGVAFFLALIFVFIPYLVVRKAFAARGVKAFAK